VIFDGRNHYDPALVRGLGFEYFGDWMVADGGRTFVGVQVNLHSFIHYSAKI